MALVMQRILSIALAYGSISQFYQVRGDRGENAHTEDTSLLEHSHAAGASVKSNSTQRTVAVHDVGRFQAEPGESDKDRKQPLFEFVDGVSDHEETEEERQQRNQHEERQQELERLEEDEDEAPSLVETNHRLVHAHEDLSSIASHNPHPSIVAMHKDGKLAMSHGVTMEFHDGTSPESFAQVDNSSQSKTGMWCANWCAKCNKKNPETNRNTKIFIERKQSLWAKVIYAGLGIGGFWTGGLTWALIPVISAFNSMTGGCSQISFQYGGPYKDKVNIGFFLSHSMDPSYDMAPKGGAVQSYDLQQLDYALECAAIAESPDSEYGRGKSKNFQNSVHEDRTIHQCFHHKWLCGEMGVEKIEEFSEQCT
jgi:hypothetical protein